MTRRMSCSLTIDAVRARTKTVTRRHVDTWVGLKPGARLTLIEKGMGLAKGERQVVLAEVEVVAVDVVELGDMDASECAAEGFPDLSPAEFEQMWCQSHRVAWPNCYVNVRRIEWRYLDDCICPDNGRLPEHWSAKCPLHGVDQ